MEQSLCWLYRITDQRFCQVTAGPVCCCRLFELLIWYVTYISVEFSVRESATRGDAGCPLELQMWPRLEYVLDGWKVSCVLLPVGSYHVPTVAKCLSIVIGQRIRLAA
jgi:hypothetical protein